MLESSKMDDGGARGGKYSVRRLRNLVLLVVLLIQAYYLRGAI